MSHKMSFTTLESFCHGVEVFDNIMSNEPITWEKLFTNTPHDLRSVHNNSTFWRKDKLNDLIKSDHAHPNKDTDRDHFKLRVAH